MTVTSKQASNQANKQAIKQSSKKTDFTVDLIWWGLPQLSNMNLLLVLYKVQRMYFDDVIFVLWLGAINSLNLT